MGQPISNSDSTKSELGYSLVHLDANTRSTKHRPGAAMVTVMRAREYRSRLHGISILVSGRRNAPRATLGLLSFGNGRSQRPLLFLFRRGYQAWWGARRRSAARSTDRDCDRLRGWEQRHGRGWSCYLRGRRMDRCDLLAMSLVVRCERGEML